MFIIGKYEMSFTLHLIFFTEDVSSENDFLCIKNSKKDYMKLTIKAIIIHQEKDRSNPFL